MLFRNFGEMYAKTIENSGKGFFCRFEKSKYMLSKDVSLNMKTKN